MKPIPPRILEKLKVPPDSNPPLSPFVLPNEEYYKISEELWRLSG